MVSGSEFNNSYENCLKQYEIWKKNKNNLYEKKLEYLNSNPISYENEKENLQRADNVLNAIDVLDNYTYNKTDNTQKMTFFLSSVINQCTGLLGAILGGFIGKNKYIKNYIDKISININKNVNSKTKIGNIKLPNGEHFGNSLLPILLGSIFGYLISNPLSNLFSKSQKDIKKEQEQDIINNYLNDPKYFATLTDEQNQKVQYIARKKIDVNDVKNEYKSDKYNLQDFSEFTYSQFKSKKNVEDNKYIFLNDSKTEEEENKIEEIEALKDQQLLFTAMEQIDHETNEYVEKVNKVSNLLNLSSDIITMFDTLIGGFLLAKINNNKITKHLNINKIQKTSKNIKIIQYLKFLPPVLIAYGIAIGLNYFSKILSFEGEKIGRFKARQKLRENPEILYYVDENTLKDFKGNKTTIIKPKGKTNFFSDIKSMVLYAIEYNKYHSKYGIENRKLQKAMSNIEITNEQYKRAKLLQKNTFMVLSNYRQKKEFVENNINEKRDLLSNLESFAINFVAIVLAPSIIMLNAQSFVEFFNKISEKGIKNLKFKDITKCLKSCALPMLMVSVSSYFLYWLKNKSKTKDKNLKNIIDMQAINYLQDPNLFK